MPDDVLEFNVTKAIKNMNLRREKKPWKIIMKKMEESAKKDKNKIDKDFDSLNEVFKRRCIKIIALYKDSEDDFDFHKLERQYFALIRACGEYLKSKKTNNNDKRFQQRIKQIEKLKKIMSEEIKNHADKLRVAKDVEFNVVFLKKLNVLTLPKNDFFYNKLENSISESIKNEGANPEAAFVDFQKSVIEIVDPVIDSLNKLGKGEKLDNQFLAKIFKQLAAACDEYIKAKSGNKHDDSRTHSAKKLRIAFLKLAKYFASNPEFLSRAKKVAGGTANVAAKQISEIPFNFKSCIILGGDNVSLLRIDRIVKLKKAITESLKAEEKTMDGNPGSCELFDEFAQDVCVFLDKLIKFVPGVNSSNRVSKLYAKRLKIIAALKGIKKICGNYQKLEQSSAKALSGGNRAEGVEAMTKSAGECVLYLESDELKVKAHAEMFAPTDSLIEGVGDNPLTLSDNVEQMRSNVKTAKRYILELDNNAPGDFVEFYDKMGEYLKNLYPLVPNSGHTQRFQNLIESKLKKNLPKIRPIIMNISKLCEEKVNDLKADLKELEGKGKENMESRKNDIEAVRKCAASELKYLNEFEEGYIKQLNTQTNDSAAQSQAQSTTQTM